MLVHRVAVEKIGSAVCGSHRQAEHSSRRIEAEPAAPTSCAVLHNLHYLVFDRDKLVAAFAWRDDAEQWIEESGHSTMQVREVGKRRKESKPNAGGR
jgi:hypothetical protein